jgi:dCMP deaminase
MFYQNQKWDERYIELARQISTYSKDPFTQTGAVIVDSSNRVVSVGYNGFPKGVKDDVERYQNRDLKNSLIVHCETNAVAFARRDLTGCVLYTWPFQSCSRCAGLVIQSGIHRCVAPPIPDDKKERWEEDMKLAAMMFEEAGLQLDIITLTEQDNSNGRAD